jgi:DNA polymerase III subunit delta
MSVHLITGDNESLMLSQVGKVVDQLVGDGDRSLMVDDFDGDDYEMRAVVDAAQTLPFLTDSRVVVARGVGRFDAEAVACLVDYLADPLPSTGLVLVAGGGRIPKALTDAVKKTGATVHDTSPPMRAADRAHWFAEHIASAGLKLDAEAAKRLASWLGEDVGRLDGILDTLLSAHGNGRTLRIDDIAPYLGEGGGVPPWDLTDAIDRGDTTGALNLLARMLGAGERHPLQVMAILHGHYGKLLAIDGLDVRDEATAAAAMGIKPGYPAKKAMEQYRKLGSGAVTRAITLLAQADLDLRGAKDWPEELVMEVLVARLSKLAGRR